MVLTKSELLTALQHEVLHRSKTSRVVFILKYLLQGHAAYRTQLFLYLKSCGCDELGTRNLWAGIDAPTPA